jgi:2-phospho-L-lactate guanylyltransferase
MTEVPGIIAIIPMKPLADSKTRLAGHISPEQRADLVIGMLWRVLMAVKGTAATDLIWVVGGDQRVRNLARNQDVLWLPDPGRNLNDTLGKSFDRAFGQGKSAMYVAGDLPFLKASDLHTVVRASRRENQITLSPARRDGGTNCILVPKGVAFLPEMGNRSFTKHLGQAAKLGISVALCHSPGLAFDLDTPEDLESYQHMEPGLLERILPP